MRHALLAPFVFGVVLDCRWWVGGTLAGCWTVMILREQWSGVRVGQQAAVCEDLR